MSQRIDPVAVLEYFDACDSASDDALPWVRKYHPRAPRRAWETCGRGDWLLWLAWQLLDDSPHVRLAACACARTTLKYIPKNEKRLLRAIETSEAYARGKATLEELYLAKAAALNVVKNATTHTTWYAAKAACKAASETSVWEASSCAATATTWDAGGGANHIIALREMAPLVREHVSWKTIRNAWLSRMRG
jgi:hypothetical protein